MLKKDNEIKWNKEARNSFSNIIKALTEAPVLISPDYTKDFHVFSFGFEHMLAGVLLQKNTENLEQPIAFYNKILRDATPKYDIMDTQSYALVRALKEFRVYILHSHIIAHVPSTAIKEVLTQLEPDGRRAKWIAVLLEYDLEIKPTKLIKGRGLAKLMAQSNYGALDLNQLNFELDICNFSEQPTISSDFLASPWYKDIVFVLQNLQAPEGLTKNQARSVKLKSTKYCTINGFLYWKDPGGILLNFLLEKEAQENIREFH